MNLTGDGRARDIIVQSLFISVGLFKAYVTLFNILVEERKRKEKNSYAEFFFYYVEILLHMTYLLFIGHMVTFYKPKNINIIKHNTNTKCMNCTPQHNP